MYKSIFTQRLELICCNLALVEAVLKNNGELEKMISAGLAENWTEFGAPAFIYSKNILLKDPSHANWLCYLPVKLPERILIGSGVYKGVPDKNGMVEIGYEIAKSYRNLGLATEMASALVEHAFDDPAINLVQAHTLAQDNPSCVVLKKCGFKLMEELYEPDDGLIWRWQIYRTM